MMDISVNGLIAFTFLVLNVSFNVIGTLSYRSRDYRLFMIQQEILAKLNWTHPPNITSQEREFLLARQYSERCYSTDCTLPNRIASDLWNDPNSNSMNVRFNVTHENHVHVTNATLRLFMKTRTTCNCTADVDQARLFVKLYQYIRPLKRRNRRPRKRLIDTRMLPWSPSTPRWIEFLVTRAAIDWITRPRRKNNGIEVAVFDQYENAINARDVFGDVMCSNDTDMDCAEVALSAGLIRQNNYSMAPTLQVFKVYSPRLKREIRPSALKNVLTKANITAFAEEKKLISIIKSKILSKL